LDLVDAWQAMNEAVKVIDAAVQEALLEYCQKTGDVYHPGSKTRYYAGHPSETKRLVDVDKIHETVLEAVGGDEASYLECLSSNAFKQATVKKVVGQEVWSKLYETKKKPKLVPKEWDGKRGEDLKFEVVRILKSIREK
jgi:hypothetical protein